MNFAEQADLRGWVVIVSIMHIIRTGQVYYLHFIRIIRADLGVADKGEMMYFLLNRLIFNCLMTTPLLIIVVIQFILC